MRKTPVSKSYLKKVHPELFAETSWWQSGLRPNNPRTRVVYDAIETAKRAAKAQVNFKKHAEDLISH